jgi:exonuclease SbcD
MEAVLEGRPVRLLKLTAEYPGAVTGMRSAVPAQRLEELAPDGVFRERYRQQFGDEPPALLIDAFHALLEEVQGGQT